MAISRSSRGLAPEDLTGPLVTAAVVGLVGAMVGLVLARRPGYEFEGYVLGAFVVAAAMAGLLMAYGATRRVYYAVLAAGLAAHSVGSYFRYEVLFREYGGAGDSVEYFKRGVQLAASLRRLDLSVLSTGDQNLWGTLFLQRVTGVVVAVTGPTMRGAFLAFSLLSFAGLVAIGAAYRRALVRDADRYLLWLLLWPSLAFWPSSIGKEAVLMLGLGIATFGFVAWPRVEGWVALVFGLGLIGFVRPHVLAVTALAMALAVLLTRGRSGRLGVRFVQVIIWAGVLVLTWRIASNALGVTSSEEATDFVQQQAGLSNRGGSATGILGTNPLFAPWAIMTAIFRPFLWESRNATGFLSAVESAVLIGLMIKRRRGMLSVLRRWRNDRLVAFSLVFVVLYSIMLGYAMSNLGILARQRILLLPFLLLLVFLARDGGRRYGDP